MSDPTILFCGGGSGGHLFPAMALVEELQSRLQGRARIVFATTGRGIEDQVLAGAMVERVSQPAISSVDLRRKPVRSSFGLVHGILKSRRTIKDLRPNLLIGLGGYGSVSWGMAARSLGVPLVLMEQNVVPGRANSLLSRFAELVFLSFQETIQYFSNRSICLVTGNPVRASVLSSAENQDRDDSRCLLVMGGSQGAEAINERMADFVETNADSLRGWTIFHQTGRAANDKLLRTYAQAKIQAVAEPFFKDMGELSSRASLAVSRAGATSLAELAVAGIPAVLVPYPNSVRDHQLLNSQVYEKGGGAIVVEQNPEQVFREQFNAALKGVLTDPSRRQEMAKAMRRLGMPNAAQSIADEVVRFL